MILASWRRWIPCILRSATRSAPRSGAHRGRARLLELELLEDRALLSVTFTPGPLTVPAVNRTDIALGTLAGSPALTPVEPFVSVSAFDPGNLIVSSQDAQRVSTNASGTFTASPTSFPLTAAAGNSSTVFDPQGRLFWANVDATNASFPGISVTQLDPVSGNAIGTAHSASNPPSGSKDDKPFLAAGSNGLYVVWTRFDASNNSSILLARSTNQGVTWSIPVTVSAASEGFVWPATVSVASNGDVYVAYHSLPGSPIDGTSGQAFVAHYTSDLSSQVTPKALVFGPGASDVTFNVQTAPRTLPQTQFWTQGSAQAWVLADPARPTNVYLIAADDPGNGSGMGDLADVVLARSTNSGATWTTSTLEAGPSSSLQLFPTAAIDKFGNLVVAWYDNRRSLTNSAGHYKLDVFAKYSVDGGSTWSSSFQVNDSSNPFDPDAGAPNRYDGPPATTRLGEYFGISVYGGTAYLAWTGNTISGSTATGQQVWMDAFPLAGTLTVNGDDGGVVTNDGILLHQMAGNPGFIEVVVNGQRQYAGLLSALSSITVNGLGDNDNFTVDFANGIPVPAGGLTFDGGAGNDQCYIGGGSGDEQFVQATGSITVSGITMNYTTTVEGVSIIGNGGNDSLTINQLSTTTQFTFDGGSGANETNTLYIGGGAADDVFSEVNNNAILTTGYMQINYVPNDLQAIIIFGNGGNDSLTINQLSTTTQFSFDGGSGTNTLIIEGSAAADQFSAVNNNAILITGYQQINYNTNNVQTVKIYGNDGNDSFTVNAYSATTTLVLDGGNGTDSLTLVNAPSPNRVSTGSGSGYYTLASPYQWVYFFNMETLSP